MHVSNVVAVRLGGVIAPEWLLDAERSSRVLKAGVTPPAYEIHGR